MTDALASLGLPELVAGAMMLALNAYVLMGGADFGGGVWDLLAHGSRGEAQRALVADAIGPIWEANHVWLIVVVVLLFTAFPTVYAALGIVLHIPLSLMLVGIVLRGSAFVFRSYGSAGDAPQRRWGRVFAIASTITPVLLGVIIGAIASGAVGAAAARIRDGGAGADPASFATLYVAPWLTPFALAVGAQALALFAFLAAVYLTLAAGDDAVREDFRRRALAAAAAVLVTAVATAWLAASRAPLVGTELVAAPWALLLQVATGAAALSVIWALWTRRWALARLAAAAQVSCILWGWALVQY
ncbi:MAG TPA: cytochrome d ubiquinol oxidase subunit II, partial [Gemmatimonadaceae bacterium]|nr:cytochrome d ubiquinol oxidase subunit II [Gemmatimonadaceae bacterium]